jgi:hypothetical protein
MKNTCRQCGLEYIVDRMNGITIKLNHIFFKEKKIKRLEAKAYVQFLQ